MKFTVAVQPPVQPQPQHQPHPTQPQEHPLAQPPVFLSPSSGGRPVGLNEESGEFQHHFRQEESPQPTTETQPQKREAFPVFRVLILTLIASGLSIFFLFVDFPGISTPQGMEQADVARTFARGEGLNTRTLRPASLAHAVAPPPENEQEMIPSQLPATGAAPLNALVNAGLLKVSGADFPIDFQYRIYFPDRVIAAGAVFFFLVALGLTFSLVSRIFDGKIAGFTVGAMLVCEMMWRFTQSGLPQMLGLFLFTAALCLMHQSLRWWRLGKVPLFPLMGAGFCFGLLTLTSPMGLGVAGAALIFVILVFRSRLLLPLFFAAMIMILVLPWSLVSLKETGSLLGTGALEIKDSWGESAGSPVMRDFKPGGEAGERRFFLARKMGRVVEQHFQHAFMLLGGSVGAAFFGLSLLHPFKNPEAARLRWALVAMWGGAMLMMAAYGTPRLLYDANQVHLWFVPLATAFGFAILSVFWARLPIAQSRGSLWGNAHLIAAVVLTGLPLFITMPGRALMGFTFSNRIVHWPPYDPAAISALGEVTDDDQVIFSDVPWAVAWYGDRTSVWLPETTEQFAEIAGKLEKQREGQVAGLFLTPQTLDQKLASGLMAGDFREWNRILLAGPMKRLDVAVFDQMPSAMKYGMRLSTSRDQESWFFSPRPIVKR